VTVQSFAAPSCFSKNSFHSFSPKELEMEPSTTPFQRQLSEMREVRKEISFSDTEDNGPE
jgi:hypothetical protein